jgi:hypothetical protein
MLGRDKRTVATEDATTNGLINSGVYTLNRLDTDEEKKLFKSKERSLLSGIWYVFILSCLLWWLPPFGQMIAGYLGGRKAGSPIKGIIVTIVPAMIILLLIIGWDVGMLPFLGALTTLPNNIYYGIYGLSPNAAIFLAEIYNSLLPVFGFEGSGFVVIVTFGLIGGMMADMTKKEILYATGGGHFYDAFLNRFSGANLSKFADMVAERVLWTLGSVEQGSMKLAGRNYYEPTPLGFEEMRSLPPHRSESWQPSYREEVIPRPYDDYCAYDEPYHDDIYQEPEPYPIAPQRPSKRRQRPEPQEPYDMDWGMDYQEVGVEIIESPSEKPKKKSGPKKSKKKSKPEVRHTREKVFNKKPAKKEKRDALIYDGEGKLIKGEKPEKKDKTPYSKKKKPAIIERAMEASKELKEKESPKETKEQELLKILAESNDEKEPPKRAKKDQSFDRL